ncbi:phosphotransferase family protein [Pseudorhodoferax sp. LjRoot39]|uniref:phosphotransferase family protein n=1 Tax=Pseudorhodoferax sp. LjRoot39 TaxID=3342328 RepID=UPI003ECD489B
MAQAQAVVQPWTELVDLDRLAAWMDAQGLGSGPITQVQPLTGGTQSVLLRYLRSGRAYVLRRPPAHPRADGNKTMQREAQVLAALAGSRVPHPALIAACADPQVLGAAFYLMEPVDGFNASVALPPRQGADSALRHRMGLSMVDALIELGEVDHVAAGLAGLGKPDGFLERQVPRWRAQLESYHDCAGWPGPAEIPGIAAVADWLEQHRPHSFRPGILHGDFHLANVLFAPDGGEVAAIVDWELVTIGDPLLDLGWLLATWPEPGAEPAPLFRTQPWQGFAAAEELVAHYAAHGKRSVEHILWYEVLACYKLGLILEGTYARACAGQASREAGALLHGHTLLLFRRALRRLERHG